MVFVMKRTIGVGYAAVDNSIFVKENIEMFLSCVKAICVGLLNAYRNPSSSSCTFYYNYSLGVFFLPIMNFFVLFLLTC
ncbi:unnamed protein product [Schistosoma turkestanicum]|nr:unnamed protein product [Schistosoma turkestanicum]